ncbi:APC family permease [soil metagenome]
MKRGLSKLALVFAVFCVVSGGPFGLEELVKQIGPGMSLVLILAIPIFWALPDALTTAELSSAIPEEGGYVVWVHRALGPFWSFANAWWSWLYTLVDASLYPVLFVTYLSSLLQTAGYPYLENHEFVRYGIALVVIALFTYLNLRGTRIVGLASSAFSALILLPFLAMAVIGAWRLSRGEGHLPLIRAEGGREGLAAGLAIVMWNYLGWDALSTVAEEVEKPEKAYPLALALVMPLVTAVYFIPTYIGLAFFPEAARWEEGAWPRIAAAVGGSWLSFAVNLAALVSPLALFTATVLGSSRLPFVLAEEGFLPKKLMAIHPRFGTPWLSILLCGAVFAILAWQKFQDLVTLNVVLYGDALILELLSLAILRVKEPNLPRPFRVKGGWPALVLVILCPMLVMGALVVQSIQEDGLKKMALTLAVLISAPIIYGIVRKRKA